MGKHEGDQGGRPYGSTEWTPEVQAKYCAEIRRGLSLESCAVRAGICETTALNWQARGQKGEEPFVGFVRERALALADWEETRLQAMDEAKMLWPREAWKLERRMQNAYGKRERVLHGNDPENPMPDNAPIFGYIVLTEEECGLAPGVPDAETQVDPVHSAETSPEAGAVPAEE